LLEHFRELLTLLVGRQRNNVSGTREGSPSRVTF
jgi:hypothetical protein